MVVCLSPHGRGHDRHLFLVRQRASAVHGVACACRDFRPVFWIPVPWLVILHLAAAVMGSTGSDRQETAQQIQRLSAIPQHPSTCSLFKRKESALPPPTLSCLASKERRWSTPRFLTLAAAIARCCNASAAAMPSCVSGPNCRAM